jgi:hypothetical protein
MKIDNIKEEVAHDMESLREKNETIIQNTMEGLSIVSSSFRSLNLRTGGKNRN